MARGAKSLRYKDLLNSLEEEQPGAKYQFLTGFLRQGRQALASADRPQLRECSRCGQPTTADVCAYCRLADRGRRKREARHVAASAAIPHRPADAPFLSK